MDGESSVPGRVAKGGHRNNPRRDLRARREAPHFTGDILEDAPHIEKVAFHRALSRPHIGVVHPEGPFGLRHENLGIRKNFFAVLVLDAVDVIRMKMRDQNRVDRFGIDSGDLEIIEHAARGVRDLTGGPCIDQDQLPSCVHQQRREGYRQYAWRQECRSERLVDFRTAGVAHEFVIDRQVPDAVKKRGELEITQFEAVNTWSL